MRLMQTLCPPLRAWTLPLAAAAFGLVFAARAAQTPAAGPSQAAKASPAPTNAAPADLEPPKSVYLEPATPQDGRDPFFPLSTRRKPKVVATPTTPVAAAAVDLVLNGISGTAGRRLAIINNRTFEAGEEGVVTPKSGPPTHIRCLDIRADSVLVQIGTVQRELKLRPGL